MYFLGKVHESLNSMMNRTIPHSDACYDDIANHDLKVKKKQKKKQIEKSGNFRGTLRSTVLDSE